MNDYYDRGDEGLEGFELFFGILSLFMVAAMIFIIYAFCPKTPKGYGGSPGHMTPMEVDEIWKKNQK